MGRTFSHSRTYVQTLALGYFYMGADKSLARPGRKQATATEDFDVHSIIIIGIQPLGRFGQRTELSQATGMALVRCILGKFLGAVCHCFPPRLDVPTFATRCFHVRHDERDPSGGRWNCGRECCPVILPK